MQLQLREVVDFEKDLKTMKTMHELKMYPPRFTIDVHGERATAASCVEVKFTGVDRNLNTEVGLPLPAPIQPPILQKTTGVVLYNTSSFTHFSYCACPLICLTVGGLTNIHFHSRAELIS